MHRPVMGTIKRLTLRRSTTKKWYVSFFVEDAPKDAVPDSEKAVGIDVGISNFAVLSDGTFIENQRYLAACEARLSEEQSKKDKLPHGSTERRKAANKVSHIYERLGNLRACWMQAGIDSGLTLRTRLKVLVVKWSWSILPIHLKCARDAVQS